MKSSQTTSKYVEKWFTYLLYLNSLVTFFYLSSPSDNFHSPKVLVALAGLLIILLFVFLKLEKDSLNLLPRKNFAPILILLLILLWFTISSIKNDRSLNNLLFGEYRRSNGLIFYFVLFLVFYLTVILGNIRALKSFLLNQTLTGGLLASLALLESKGFELYNSVDSTGTAANQFITTTLGNSNYVSQYLSICVISSSSYLLLREGNANSKRLVSLALLLQVFAILRIGDMQGKINLVLALIFLAIFILIRRKLVYFSNFRFLPSIVLGFVFFNVAIFLIFLHKINITQFEDRFGSSIVDRLYFWQTSIKMIISNPIFGSGFGSFDNEYRIFRDESNYLYRTRDLIGNATDSPVFDAAVNDPHNLILNVGAIGGIPALVLICIMFFYFIMSLIKSSFPYKIWLSLSVLFAVTVSSFSYTVLTLPNMFNLMIIAGLIVKNTEDKSNTKIGNTNSFNLVFYKILIVFLSLIASFFLYLQLMLIRNDIDFNNIDKRIVYSQDNREFTSFTDDLANYSDLYLYPRQKNVIAVDLFQIGLKDQALSLLLGVAFSNPSDLESLQLLATIYEIDGKKMDAKLLWKKVSEIDPQNLSLRRYLE